MPINGRFRRLVWRFLRTYYESLKLVWFPFFVTFPLLGPVFSLSELFSCFCESSNGGILNLTNSSVFRRFSTIPGVLEESAVSFRFVESPWVLCWSRSLGECFTGEWPTGVFASPKVWTFLDPMTFGPVCSFSAASLLGFTSDFCGGRAVWVDSDGSFLADVEDFPCCCSFCLRPSSNTFFCSFIRIFSSSARLQIWWEF